MKFPIGTKVMFYNVNNKKIYCTIIGKASILDVVIVKTDFDKSSFFMSENNLLLSDLDPNDLMKSIL